MDQPPLHDDSVRRRLVSDVAAVVNDIFSLNCCGLFEIPAKDQSFRALLIRESGNALTTMPPLGTSSLFQRRTIDHARQRIHARLEALAHFSAMYRFLLSDLAAISAHCSHLDDAVDIFPVVASPSSPSGGYFVRVSLKASIRGDAHPASTHSAPLHGSELPLLNDDVSIGGFACELARLLEAPIEAWIRQCEDRIDALFASRDGPDDEFGACGGDVRYRRAELRRRLVSIFSQHVAMVGLYTAPGSDFVLQLGDDRDQHFVELMQQLATDFSNDAVRNECARRREADLSRLGLLRLLCASRDDKGTLELAQRISEQRLAVLDVLKSPPVVLTRRPGYASFNWHFSSLSAVVRNANSSIQLTAVQLQEWRNTVGFKPLDHLALFIDQAAKVLANQTFPINGFLPTLRLVQPPPPTWTSPSGAAAAYAQTRASLPMSSAQHPDVHMQMPMAVEKMLRLISLIWEMLAYAPMRDFFFSPGIVSARHLREIVSVEQVSVAFAMTVVNSWRQRANWGSASRDAASAISRFRGAEIEDYIRDSVARLRHWSLADVMSVVSEAHSPTFLQTKWQLVDAVAQCSGSTLGDCSRFSGAMGRVLDLVEPIVVSLRADAGIAGLGALAPHPRATALADLLRLIPALRRWDGSGHELVLTLRDVKESKSTEARRALDEMAGERRSMVTFGRVGSDAKRVFRFRGPELRAVLFDEDSCIEELDGDDM
jgi:hypothetical protein